MDTERGAACRLLVETTRRPFLPDMSEQVDHMSREFYPELDLDNKPLLYVTPNFPPVTTAEPHRDLSREGSSRNGAFTVDVKTVSGSKEEFAIKRLPLTTALAEVAMTQYVGSPLLSSSTYDNREAQWFQGPFGMDYDSIQWKSGQL